MRIVDRDTLRRMIKNKEDISNVDISQITDMSYMFAGSDIVELPDNVDIMDGGTGSFDLMPILSQYPLVIFIDATMDGKPAGTIDVIYPEFAKDFPTVLSAHDVGLKDMIDALEFQDELPRIILLTISIKEMIPMTIKLTEEAQNSIPKITKKVVEILEKVKIVDKQITN